MRRPMKKISVSPACGLALSLSMEVLKSCARRDWLMDKMLLYLPSIRAVDHAPRGVAGQGGELDSPTSVFSDFYGEPSSARRR